MSITRTPLCTVKVCPRPNDPWFHECERCGSPAVHHHHREPKGMGGSKKRDVKENIVMLCHRHHEEAHRIGAATGEGEVQVMAGKTEYGSSPLLPSAPLPSPAGVSPELAIDAGTDERGNNLTSSGGQTVQGLRPSVAPGLGATHG